ncbi:MAG: DUF378 domain-containing protein [Myxococcaceae bacterium]
MEQKERTRNAITTAVLVIAIIGAINWGLIGFFNFNLVDAIFGGGAREATSGLSRVIYALVGLCGLALIALFPSQARVRGGPGVRHRAEV